MTKENVVIKEFWVKKPDSELVKIKVRFDKANLQKPVYLVRSE